MKLLMILVLTFYGCLLLAEEQKVSADEQKVCEVTQGGRYAEKVRKTLQTNNCQIGDILFIRGQMPRSTMAITAHACIIETIHTLGGFTICEYRGLVRDNRKTKKKLL